jgi:hypothetical protein
MMENRNYRCSLAREEYYGITHNMLEAIILNQMIYWSERVSDFDQFIAEEKQRLEGKSDGSDGQRYGWIRKSAAELKEEIMTESCGRTVSRKLDSLVEKGFLLRRSNPNYHYDHKYQYRVNFKAILPAMDACGLTMINYRTNLYPETVTFPHPAAQPEVKKLLEHPTAVSGGIPENLTEIITAAISEALTIVLSKILPDTMQASIADTIAKAISAIIPAKPPTSSINFVTPSEKSVSAVASESTLPVSKPVKKERFHFRRKKNSADLDKLLESIGIDTLEDKNVSEQMKTIISDLWCTNRIGKKSVSHGMIMKALSSLTPKSIEVIYEKYTRQEKKGLINYPSEYIKTLIMNAPQDWELRKLAQTSNSTESKPEHDTPSYDMDEFIRLSLARLNGPDCYSVGAGLVPA